MEITNNKIIVGCGVVALFGLAPWPYFYYVLVRFAFFRGLIWFGWLIYQRDQKITSIHVGIGLLAILYNPVLPVHLGSKLIWFIINLATLAFMFSLMGKIDEEKL